MKWNSLRVCVCVCECPATWPMIAHSFWIILQHWGWKDPKDCDAGQRFKSRNEEENNCSLYRHCSESWGQLFFSSFYFLKSCMLQSCKRKSGSRKERRRITAVLEVDEAVDNALAFPVRVCRPDAVTGSWSTRDQASLAVTLSNMSTIHDKILRSSSMFHNIFKVCFNST